MSARSWMPLYWKDLIADTVDLTPAEMGAYVRLLGRYWNSGEALLSDDARLARIAGMDADEWAAARPALVDLFDEREGRWFHGRVDAELIDAQEKYERRRAAGKRGGRPSKESNAKAKLSDCESGGKAEPNQPQPQPHYTEPNGSGAAAPPNDDMKARLFGPVLEWLTERSERSRVGVRSQIGRWCKLYGDGAVLAAAQRAYTACRDGPPVDPIAWMEAALKKDAKHGKQPDVGERIARDAEDIDRYFRVEPGDEPAGDGEPVFDFDGDCRRVA